MFTRLFVPVLALALLLAACGETITPLGQPAEAAQATTVAQNGVKVARSVPLVYEKYDDAARTNMAVALAANGNKLRHEHIIMPGERWSWGEQLGDIDVLLPKLQPASGVLGGGWSDLAARYSSVWEGLGLKAEYQRSQRPLIDIEPSQSPMLWLGDPTGNADVVLVNDGPSPVALSTEEDGEKGQLTVVARIGKG